MTLTSLFEKIQVARYICEKTFTCFILNNGNFRPRAIKTYATTICRREKLKIMNTVVGFEQGKSTEIMHTVLGFEQGKSKKIMHRCWFRKTVSKSYKKLEKLDKVRIEL